MIPLSQADWSRIPYHLRRSLQAYAEQGRVPGRFLQGVLADRLRMTIESADPKSMRALYDIMDFIHRYLPLECYGTPERVADWEATGGLDGKTIRDHLMRNGLLKSERVQ